MSGDDELAEYDRKVKVWISSKHNMSKNLLDDLESLLNSSSAINVAFKDVSYNGTEGVEGKYWTRSEAGLLGIFLFPGLIYAIDGSQEKGNMRTSTGMKSKRAVMQGKKR